MNKKLFSMLFAILIFTIVPHAFAEYEDTIVVMETDLGRFIIEFFPDSAPNHVKNFVELSNTGFYTDTKFHRIIEGFMIQGGDPLTAKVGHSPSEWGTGDPGYSIDAEFNNIQHSRGILSMARSADPNSAGSQFFIVHKDSNFLDGQYTVFGRIITEESFVTLDKLATLETAPNDQPMKPSVTTIKVVQVLDRSELSDLPKYVPPKITSIEEMVAPPTNQKQVFKEYGFGFISPAGWLVQTPPVTSSTSPQVAVVGPKTSTSMPAISIRADPSLSKTLDENVDALRQNILPLIESGALKIAGEESLEINGYDAHMIKAVGHFEDSSGVEQRIGFASIMIKNGNVVYTIQYTNTIESFDAQEQYYIDMINSLELFVPQPMGVNSEGNMDGISSTLKDESQSEGGGCLIATAAFGSEMAPQVQFLREIRDNTVMSTQSGTAFMTGFNQFYYSFSPAVADYERENPVFKEAVKVTLTPLLTSLTLLNYVDVDSEQEMLGYGIGIILLNIGMYFVAPAAAIVVIKNRIKHV